MSEIVRKKESESGKTLGTIEQTKVGFTGRVVHLRDGEEVDVDERDFTTLRDADGWLELTFFFMLGVHADG